MKTFLRLSLFVLVCLGFALVLVGQPADAQMSYELTIAGVTGADYKKDDTPTITYTLVDSNGVPQRGVTMNLVSTGVQILTPGRVTNVVGHLEIQVKILSDVGASLQVTPQPLSRYAVRSTTLFNVEVPPDEKPIIAVLSPNPKEDIAVGDTFTQTIEIRDVADLSAWQMDIVFNPAILELVEVTEGDFLESDGINAFFPTISINDSNASGRIRASQARIGRKPNASPELTTPSPAGVDGPGDLLTLKFKVLDFAEAPLGIHNVQLSNSDEERISYSILVTDLIVVTNEFPAEDVNRDRQVNVQDLLMVANDMGTSNSNLGRAKPINPRTDVNDDGFVNVLDLVAVYSHPDWGKAVTPTKIKDSNKASLAAPAASVESLTPAIIQGWIDLAQVEDDGSIIFDRGIANLESLLASKIPSKTRLLLNYPNPFNPETWIPYQLAESTDVTVTIHSVNGSLIRTLALGHQAAGLYQSKSQAAYWDGRNEFGEQVASGLYFYTLTAGNFSATGKMLVRK